jgi:hypothetical protein
VLGAGGDVYTALAAKVWRGDPDGARAHQLRDAAKTRPQVDTAHALVFDEDIADAAGAYRFYATRYATLCALLQIIDAENSEHDVSIPRVLGAGGLIVCLETREVIFLRRAKSKTMHPGRLHVFGGNLEPDPHEMGEFGRDRDLKGNAIREISEESSAQIKDFVGALVFAHKEIADPAIHDKDERGGDRWKRLMRNLPVHHCGVLVDRVQRDKMETHETLEGNPEPISIGDLERRLRDADDWVPAGWYTTMLWLWMGAPVQGPRALISEREAHAIAARILATYD